MSFVGKPHISGAVFVWDGDKLLADRKVINLQNAYDNERFVQLADTICFIGDPLISEPKLDLVHTSPFEDDEGLRLTTSETAGATCWKPIVAYDKNGNKVFEVETDTNSSIVAVKSTDVDGYSGYQFLNEIGTFLALDTTSSPTSLRIQKAGEGYIDFGGSAYSSPILRIDTNNTEPAVNIGNSNSNNMLIVNGIDITPYSSKIIIPIASVQNHALFNIASFLDNDQYATVNIDVLASTNDLQQNDKRAFSAWKFFISLFKQSDAITVVSITELDQKTFSGETATDDPTSWDVNITSDGILFAYGNGSQHKIAFAATIIKISVIDILTGNIIK